MNTSLNNLNNLRIVLINTSHPGNIGSAARAMKTMGLTQLYLVEPKRYPAADATMMSAGADDILANAKVVSTLDEAIADCQLVVGTSARDRSLPWPMLSPREAAERMVDEVATQKVGQAAILFGREAMGLSNEELQRCHFHVQIPANPNYSSLNLASAVQVLCYEMRVASLGERETLGDVDGGGDGDGDIETEFANHIAMERFYEHLEKILLQIEFLNPKNPNRIMPRLRRLFNRARVKTSELDILRGILTEVGKFR